MGVHRFWQPDFFDRLLRDDEPLETVAGYLTENPIRANLARKIAEYPFAWCKDGVLDRL